MEQAKLTFKEVVIAMLTSFLAPQIFMWSSHLLAWICYQLNFGVVINVIVFLVILLACLLYVNYLMFIKFDAGDGNDRQISRIARIKNVFQSIQLRRVLLSKDTLFFLLTNVCGMVAAVVMTIGALFTNVQTVKWIDVVHFDGLYEEFSAWSGFNDWGIALVIVLMAFVPNGVVSCIFAKWIALRTRNAGVKWAAILPIICLDLFALLVLIGTPIEMLIRVLSVK